MPNRTFLSTGSGRWRRSPRAAHAARSRPVPTPNVLESTPRELVRRLCLKFWAALDNRSWTTTRDLDFDRFWDPGTSSPALQYLLQPQDCSAPAPPCLVFTPCRLESRNPAHTYQAWTRSSRPSCARGPNLALLLKWGESLGAATRVDKPRTHAPGPPPGCASAVAGPPLLLRWLSRHPAPRWWRYGYWATPARRHRRESPGAPAPAPASGPRRAAAPQRRRPATTVLPAAAVSAAQPHAAAARTRTTGIAPLPPQGQRTAGLARARR